jgi:hypothetical protein
MNPLRTSKKKNGEHNLTTCCSSFGPVMNFENSPGGFLDTWVRRRKYKLGQTKHSGYQ